MSIDVIRFGVGHRRPDGPPGTTGVEGQVIHSDARGIVAELAFRRGGRIEPHSNPNSTWFCVIEGGGWVSVGDEERRVAAGEAIAWPPDEVHAAWTDHGPMRAIVVEFAGPDDGWARGVIEAAARPALTASRGEGALASRLTDLDPNRDSEGEPA